VERLAREGRRSVRPGSARAPPGPREPRWPGGVARAVAARPGRAGPGPGGLMATAEPSRRARPYSSRS